MPGSGFSAIASKAFGRISAPWSESRKPRKSSATTRLGCIFY